MIKFLFAFVLLCNMTFGGDAIVEALRTDEIGGSLGDIDCRMWTPDPPLIFRGKKYLWSDYRDTDKVTWAHEGTHSINSRIRNTYSGIDYGFYILESKAITLSEMDKSLTLQKIANKVPQSERKNPLYKNYLVGPGPKRYWNEQPLYIMDELVSFVNGAIVGVESSMKRRALESYSNAVVVYGYADILYQLGKDTEYEDLDDFKILLDIIQRRLVILEKVINLMK